MAGRWSRAWGPVERGDDFLWAGTTYEGSDAAERQRIEGDLEQAVDDLDELQEAAGWIASELSLPIPATSTDADLALGVLELCDQRPIVPETWLTIPDTLPIHSRIAELKDLCQTHDKQVGRLIDLVGNDWASLDPEACGRVRSLATSIRHSPLGVTLANSPDAEDLAAIATALDRSVDVLDEIIAEADELRNALTDKPVTMNFRDTRALASVAALIGGGPDPDEKWLDSLVIYRVRESARALEDAVEDFQRRKEDLGSVFDDDVLDLDVEALAIRYETVHRGIRKLSSSYRDDKRSVAGVSRTGKASREVTDRLPDVVEWQLSRDRWRDAEDSHEDVVGDHYYRAEKTDFRMIEAALSRSETILTTSCDLVSARGLREHFSVQCDPSSHLKTVGTKTLDHLEVLADIAAVGGMDAREAVIADITPQGFRDSMTELVGVVRRLIEDMERVDEVARQPVGLDVARDALDERKRLAETLSTLQDTRDEDELLLGDLYRTLATDWDAVEESLAWTEDMRALLNGPLEVPVATAVLGSEVGSEALRPQVVAWEKSRKAVSNGFDEGHRLEVSDALEGYFDGARHYLVGLRESIDDVGEWAAFQTARTDLDARGLGEVTAYCVDSSIDADQVVPTVERAVLVQWVDKTLKKDKRLKPERRKDRGAILKEFRDLDRMMAGHAVARVIQSCNARRPSMTELGGAAVIKREGMKKTRHRPIRTLMADARDVIQAVKPCFMMSPLTVSQYLDPETRFDLVIFDEASQVLPADAVNCIYRGKQVVIAGDQKQLPPTTFFQRMGDDDESAEFDEDDLDQFESILDIAKGSGLTSLPLLWHYRSRHESLITYSNFSFYDGDLVTYPSATDLGQDIGIEFFKVDGIYRRGTSRDNPIEAEKVAERVIFHARNHPDLTVGVVAFSEAQASLIQDVVDQKRREHPELDDYFVDDRLSGFFVKNLENVQGDERDIMIFSIGYGPDEMGVPVKGNFGPLTRAGGERRLNVAITRARRRVEVVSSIDSSDFKSSWKSAGARHLKRYLDFAERGMPALALDLEDAVAEPESPFEEDVLDVIRSWSYDVVPQVGTAGYRIDMGVRDPTNPGRYAIGIECDGAMYHSSRAARDRDRLRQEVLEGLGWTIYRIWGTSWYRSRTVEKRLLREAIEAAIDSDKPRVTLPVSPEVDVSVMEVDHSAPLAWTTPYELAHPDVPRHLAMSDGSARPKLQEAIRDVVYVEGPVTEEVTLSRIREAWGVGRAGRRIQQAFHGQLRILEREGEITMDRRRVLWWTDLKDALTVRVPVEGEPETQRKATQVPREELQLAVVELLRDAISADRDELTLMVSKLFGWRRRGSEISTILDGVVTGLLRGKRIVRDGDQLRVGQP
ncbi:MAG: DUF3320 domain-containing protein [Actinomycetia bacterium]|nr:DUF3320 domain-containing protein [Actinomycetes bacterium]